MGPCTLQIAGRIVLRSTGAPPEAEYALFEPGEIELRATEPGTVRELGYRTTVATARSRLADIGITAKLAEEAALAMRPGLAQAYARGPVVRRVATHFGATEMFDGQEYDPKERTYRGAWLDLPALTADLATPGASNALQALYLASLLYEVAQDAQVMLHTLEYTKERRPGERTHRRVPLEQAPGIVEALRKLSWNIPSAPLERDKGPSKVELLDAVRGRSAWCGDPETRAQLALVERALATRDQPTKGPLAEADLWALETRMSADQLDGVLDALDSIEKKRGRMPATAYLRARASLMHGKEDPRLIAERVSALALSMSSFAELGLLAAQAWLAAGDGRRALPYARDLMENPSIDDELRMRAEMIFAQTGMPPSSMPGGSVKPQPLSAKPILSIGEGIDLDDTNGEADSIKLSAHPTVRQHVASAMPPASRASAPPDRDASSVASAPPSKPVSSRPDSRASSGAPPKRTSSTSMKRASSAPAGAARTSTAAPRTSSSSGMRRASSSAVQRVSTTPRTSAVPPTSPASAGPRASAAPRTSSAPQTSSSSSRAAERASSPPRISSPPRASVPYSSLVPERDDSEDTPPSPERPERAGGRSSMPAASPARPSAPPPASPARQSAPPPASPSAVPAQNTGLTEMRRSLNSWPDSRAEPDRFEPGDWRNVVNSTQIVEPETENTDPYMRGASQPAFKTEQPPPSLPRPILPRMEPGASEAAETLSLPPGLHGQAAGTDFSLPASVIEARVQFTHLSRELGKEYRLERGIELRTDVAGIEAMQHYLREAYTDRVIQTPQEALEVRKHGAFISEILARTLGAEWTDIGPSELGYWGMIVPPGTRVWPFARVLRLIQMGHKERDLVSYYLELQARTRR